MNITKLVPQFKRLNIISNFRKISTTNSLLFNISPCLMAEPLKKKKKLDPAVVRAREERKKRKIEKQIRKLEKNSRQPKPISECEVPLLLLDEKLQRQRTVILNEDTLENRALLVKKWANYKRQKLLTDLKEIDRFVYHQQRALDQLRTESEQLYQKAIKTDFFLIPFQCKGPSQTPPLDENAYAVPDGEYLDVSKVWK